MRGFMAEIRSWINWIYYYRLPCWVSTPFKYKFFKYLYSFLLLALVLIFIPLGPIRELSRQILVDAWIKTVGENSLIPLNNFLNSFLNTWILPTLIILILWGLIVWIWAWKIQLFFNKIDDLGIKIVRGPGKRLPFLKRLQEAGISALGLGPSAKLLEIYYPCEEDQILREEIKSLQKNRTNLGLLITGPATSGKTRVAMEVIANSRTSLVFIWPKTLESRTWANIPEWKGSAIVVVDNIYLSQKDGEIPLSSQLYEFLLQCRKTILVGTIRKELLPQEHKMLGVVELNKINKEDLKKFAVELAKIESKAINKHVIAENVIHRYNGYPASLVAGLDAMREIYNGLSQESRTMLQAGRVLWEMGVRILTTERIWEVTDLLSGSESSQIIHDQILRVLLHQGFISMQKNEQQWIEIYEAYFDQVIDLPNGYTKIEQDVIVLWENRGDANAFIERGNTFTDTYSVKYQIDPKYALQLGISAYKEALRFYTPELTPLDYATTQNNFGTAYRQLAAHQDPDENLQRAISAYEEALRFYTPELTPLDYAMTQNNLGNAYGDLAAHQDPVVNLQRAISAYEAALRFRTPELTPLDYAMTQNNLGTAYADLAAHQDPGENLQRAISAYEEALRFYTPELTPQNYATTQNNLGTAYADLAAHQDPGENLQRAISTYKEALRFRTPELTPLDYAMTQNNLGTAYEDLAAHQDPVVNLQRAISAYKEALRFRTPELTPLKYAATQNNLGIAYRQLAAHQDPVENLQRAISAYKEALRFYTPELNPLVYAMTQKNLDISLFEYERLCK